MDHRGEVEFLPDDGRPEVGEKVLPTRQRIRPPRWMWLAVVGVAVLLIAAFLGRHASPTHRRANPSIQAGPSGGIASQAPPSVGQPLPLAAGGPAIDLAMAGRVTWVLQPRRITVVDDLVARRATADWPGVSAQDFAVLRVDPSHAELWIITEGASPGRVLEYDA
jgi:hypothetical protein